jgi:ABC-type dipeptide/oligopeptide/nickel transport system permease subunit
MIREPGLLEKVLAAEVAAQPKTAGSSLRRDTLRNILRQRSAVVGLVILAILFLTAIFAPLIATHDPIVSLRDLGETNITRGDPPCIHALGCALDKPEHLFGIDAVIRDEFSRVVYGARISLQVGFITVGFAIVLGSLIGAIAGFFGGWIVTVLGPGLINAQLAIGIVSIPIYARVMRASVLSVRENDFVTASRALGESSAGILSRRILPNALTPLIVQGTLGIGGAILEVAALSFVGLGAQPPAAEWGSMIALDRSLFFSAPHLIFFPGLAITFTVLGFNLLGDGIRDALDPRLNR